ncbi:hypothetical protein SynA15127_01503 [Synechococcus sp. A15-127]|nr:hypothetical protein SynA15127_01503 [Synechococcus sp. A15-127]
MQPWFRACHERSAHHQLKFLLAEIVGGITTVNALKAVIIAFIKSNSDWVA